jgi:hypothetical protein
MARGELDLAHETLDQQPPSRAIRHLEHLLVAVGALPARDPALARLERWIGEQLAAHGDEPALRTFAHWVLLRRYRRKSQQAPLNDGLLSRPKAELRAAAAFVEWLRIRGRGLEECCQADIDAWLAGPRADRYIARGFARWAMTQKLMPSLEYPGSGRIGPAPPIVAEDVIATARRLLHDPAISPRDRVAAVLIAVFAQPVSRVARLTADQVILDGERVSIKFGETAVGMPEPVANDIRGLLAASAKPRAGIVRQPRWLLTGKTPGRPIGELPLSQRLKRIGIDCKDRRHAALLHLAARMPAAILADLIGIHISTATEWAEIAGRPWADYPALRGAEAQS